MTKALLLYLFLHPAASSYAEWLSPLKNGGSEVSTTSLTGQFVSDIESWSLTTWKETTEEDVRDLEDYEDSDADIFISTTAPEPPPPVNLGGNGSLTLTRLDTKEKINARYRNKDGTYNQVELKRLNHLMRCSLTGRETHISVKLIELLDAIEDKFGRRGLTLLSGYRTFKLNEQIPGAAKQSLHMLGWAADIKIPGYTSTAVKKYVQKRAVGGVGYYPSMGFTHLDVGKVRYWVVKKPQRRRPVRRAKRSVASGKNIQKPKKAPVASRVSAKRGTTKRKPA